MNKSSKLLEKISSNTTESTAYKSDQIELDRLYATIDPETGYRYSIPLLLRSDPDYVTKYIEYMRVKEDTPEVFSKIINWG